MKWDCGKMPPRMKDIIKVNIEMGSFLRRPNGMQRQGTYFLVVMSL